MRTLILDNYDSFAFNLFQVLGELGASPVVVRNDKISFEQVVAMRPDRIVISPGPGSPEDPAYFGICTRVIRELGPKTPILGVCLGHQGIAHAFGGRVVRAPMPMHGKTSLVYHNDAPLFAGVPPAFEVMRYHSLVAERASLPSCLDITAKTWDEIIMGVQHKGYPIFGVQFHPESIGTHWGKKIVENFLRIHQLLQPISHTLGTCA